MTVMVNHVGLPVVCGIQGCGAPATFVWYGTWNGLPNYTCQAHNPMSLPAALPTNFTGHSICPACGK